MKKIRQIATFNQESLITQNLRLEASRLARTGEKNILFTFLAMTRFVPKTKPFPQPKKITKPFFFHCELLRMSLLDSK